MASFFKNTLSFPFTRTRWTKSIIGHLAIVIFQRVEVFGVLGEVSAVPGVLSFLFIQFHDVFDGNLLGWYLLQFVTTNHCAHTAPGPEYPVPRRGKSGEEHRYRCTFQDTFYFPDSPNTPKRWQMTL